MRGSSTITLIIVGFLLVVTPTLVEMHRHSNICEVLTAGGHLTTSIESLTELPMAVAAGMPLLGAACLVYAAREARSRRGPRSSES
jgi:hypothetical protein